jgi:ATP-dependent helicase/nuclease subunit A
MTRPRDRLILAGFERNKKPRRESGCWFDLVCEALGVSPDAPGDDAVLYRSVLVQADGIDPDGKANVGTDDVTAQERPAWASSSAPRERSLSIPLAPSRLAPYDSDDDGEPLPKEPTADPLAEPSAIAPARSTRHGAGLVGDRFLRGTLTHALLEHLPGIRPDRRATVATVFLDTRAGHLPAQTRQSIATEALAIVDHPEFSALFGETSRAEVPIVAEIPHPSGRGPALKLTGQLDRLAVTDDAVLVIDYKTNRAAPATAAEVAPIYLYQLAAYRLALREIYPEKPIRAALLWTEVPHLMEIPQKILDKYTNDLWQLDVGSLDAGGRRS